MKIIRQPMLTTVIYGLLSGVSFIPLVVALSYIINWPMAFRLILWTYLLGYVVFLTRWARANLLATLFPLVLMLSLILWEGSESSFLFTTLGILSWVRSGICFQGSLLRTLGAEVALSLGGGVLVAYFDPHSMMAWAVAIWMFFLVQSLYFVFVSENSEAEEGDVELDPFEQAKERAENIMAADLE